MRWVYILRCENDYYYVGETSRLYRRFWEHYDGRGGLNTSIFRPINIIAIYSINRLGKFFDWVEKSKKMNYNCGYNIYFDRGGIIEHFNENDDNDDELYDNLQIENNITEKMMMDSELNYQKIKGGKYTRFNVLYSLPNNNIVKELPNCLCGFPCDVKKNDEYGYLYFRCAKKNIWESMRNEFDIEEQPCNYFMKYVNDSEYRTNYIKRLETVKLLTDESYWLQRLAGGIYEHCVGGCGKEYDENNTVRYGMHGINLCFDCFINNNKTLKIKYTQQLPIGKCIIDLNSL